jgi:hypothetical protein
MPPKRSSVKVAQWFWWNDSEWIPYTADQNEALEQNRAVSLISPSSSSSLTHIQISLSQRGKKDIDVDGTDTRQRERKPEK